MHIKPKKQDFNRLEMVEYSQDDADVVDDECKPLDKLLLPELDDDEVLITLADDDVV